MASIEIRKQHGTTADDASRRSRELLAGFAEKRQDLVREIRWAPDGRSAEVFGKGFSGRCRVDDAAVHVQIDLKLIARPFKSRIAASLNRRFDAEFTG